MREYGRVAPTFWTRGSGKKLRGHPAAQVVALYLFTCPASTMLGIYHIALPTLAHETGLTVEQAIEALALVCQVGIARYDEADELVYLPEGARYQIGERLKPGDRRVKGIETSLSHFGAHPFAAAFREHYASDFCLAPAAAILPQEGAYQAPYQGASTIQRDPSEGSEQTQNPLGSQARQGADQAREQANHTHIARAPAREAQGEDEARLRPPPCSEADLAAVLRGQPLLAALADDALLVTDLHASFTSTRGVHATPENAQAACARLVGQENVREMSPAQRRDRVSRYLNNQRPERGAVAPVEQRSPDAQTVLIVFGEVWAKAKRRGFVQSVGDGKHAEATAEAARAHASTHRLDELVRHWARMYLADGDKFVADREHPLSLLPSRLTSYGLPSKKPAPASEKPAAADSPLPDPAETARAAERARAAMAGIGGAGAGRSVMSRPAGGGS